MHAFAPFFAAHPALAHFAPIALPLIAAIALWTLIWKGFALWYAAGARQKAWFIVLLIVNTLGILEIIYLIWFRPRHTGAALQPEESSPAA